MYEWPSKQPPGMYHFFMCALDSVCCSFPKDDGCHASAGTAVLFILLLLPPSPPPTPPPFLLYSPSDPRLDIQRDSCFLSHSHSLTHTQTHTHIQVYATTRFQILASSL